MKVDNLSPSIASIAAALPVENFTVVSASLTSLSFSWNTPGAGDELIVGYVLTCLPLLIGIVALQPLNLEHNATSATITGLHSGMVYQCSIATISSEGLSKFKNITFATLEIGNYSCIIMNFLKDIYCKVHIQNLYVSSSITT